MTKINEPFLNLDVVSACGVKGSQVGAFLHMP